MSVKRMSVFAIALVLAISPCFYKTVKANEIEKENIEKEDIVGKDTKAEAASEEFPEENDVAETEEPLAKTNTTMERDADNEEVLNIEESSSEDSDDKTDKMFSLQVPQGIEIVMDPWEMDGKKQIYSEQYTVKNCGETAGHLVLSELTYKAESKEISIQTDKEGLHEGDEKLIYMEMIFGDGKRIVLSSDDSQYETDLEPGEEASFCFSGEVNENASVEWEGSDILVSVAYSWDTEPEEELIEDESAELSEEKSEAGLAEAEKRTGESEADTDGQETQGTDVTDGVKEIEEDRKKEPGEIKEKNKIEKMETDTEESAEETEKNVT